MDRILLWSNIQSRHDPCQVVQEKLESIVNAFARELTRGKAPRIHKSFEATVGRRTCFLLKGVHEAGAKWPPLLPPLLGAELFLT